MSVARRGLGGAGNVDVVVPVVVIVVACFAVGFLWVHRNDPPAPPRPCADYANVRAERVPARCFDDFHPERP